MEAREKEQENWMMTKTGQHSFKVGPVSSCDDVEDDKHLTADRFRYFMLLRESRD